MKKIILLLSIFTSTFLSAQVSGWVLSGNSNVGNTSFLGSTNNRSLRFRVNNSQKVLLDSLRGGFYYTNNYHSGATNFWLTDKKYVDSMLVVTGGAYLPLAGGTMTGTTIWGGSSYGTSVGSVGNSFVIGSGNNIDVGNLATEYSYIDFNSALFNHSANIYSNNGSGNSATVGISGEFGSATLSATGGGVSTSLGISGSGSELSSTNTGYVGLTYSAPTVAGYVTTNQTQYSILHRAANDLRYAPTVGSTSITTVGTVTTGVWNGTVIGTTYGGTGISNATNTSGSILRSNGTNGNFAATTATYPNTVTSGQALYGTATNVIGSSALFTFSATSGLSVANTTNTLQNVIFGNYNGSTVETTVGTYYSSVNGNTTTDQKLHATFQTGLNGGTPGVGHGAALRFIGVKQAGGAFFESGRITSYWATSAVNDNKGKTSIWSVTNTGSAGTNIEVLSVGTLGVLISPTQARADLATAYLQLGAGTASASTAPLKLTSGTNLTVAEAGVLAEYDGTNFYGTPNTTVGRWPHAFNSLQYTTPVTTETVTTTAQMQSLVCNPAGTIAALTIVFPPSPVNGQQYQIAISQIITVLTLTAGTGAATINGTITTTGVNSSGQWVYEITSNTWYKTQ